MKRTLKRTFLLAGLGFAAAASTASAQRPQTREGFTAAVGLGAASAALSCDVCGSDREGSVGVRLFFGGALRPNVILGGEIEGWSKEVDGATVTLSWVNFVSQWYPAPASGFFVKGGVGLAARSFEITDGFTNVKLESTGPGLVVGAGYDIRVGRNFSLTPYGNFLFGAKGEAKVNAQQTNAKIGANVIHVGVAATWH